MNLFKRAKSSASKHSANHSELSSTSSTSSSASSSPRPPLVPQTNIDLLPAALSGDKKSYSSSSAGTSSYDSNLLKPSIGKKIAHHDAEEHSKPHRPSQSQSSRQGELRGLGPAPQRSPPRSVKTTYSNHPDMYAQNDLNTFTFGAAPASTSHSSLYSPVDPLSRPRGDADSDEVVMIPDTTPRPSVVGGEHPRSHQSHHSELEDWETGPSPFRVNPHHIGSWRGRDSDVASTHTFGTSSASASASSLSGPNGSRATSRASGHSSTTPLTSGNDLTSDDEDDDGRHPLPPEPLESPSPPRGFHRERQASVYFSDEDFELYVDDSDTDHDEMYMNSGIHEIDNAPGYPQSQGVTPLPHTERRGSAAMAIPNTPSNKSYVDHREREASIATLRRPSKSLDELYSFSFAQASGPSTLAGRGQAERTLSPAPTSVPESEGDWRDLRKRSIQRDKDLPPIVPSKTHASNIATSINVDGGNTTTPPTTTEGLGFDSSWMQQYRGGVVGFDMEEVADVVGGRRPSALSYRKGSSASAFRRFSTVSSNNIDIMHKNIQVWGNQKYQDQRTLWVFKRENDHIDDVTPVTRTTTMDRDKERSSIASLFSPRQSITHAPDPNVHLIAPFLDEPAPREKEKGKTPKEPWKGMALDSEEIWTNAATGRYRVNRKNAIVPESRKPPQQRLNITYIRNSFVQNVTNRDTADGPAVTIHKHSKASAFSISRHYRTKSSPMPMPSGGNPSDLTVALRNPRSRGEMSSRESEDRNKKHSSMILLGTRRVQKAYTTTNTTRKLESHGLLDDNGEANPKDVERRRREREREKSGKDKGKLTVISFNERSFSETSKGKTKERSHITDSPKFTSRGGSSSRLNEISSHRSLPESFEGNSTGNGSIGAQTLVNKASTSREPSDHTRSAGSVEQSVFSHDTDSSDRTISKDHFYRRRSSFMDEYEYDSSDERRRPPTRTTYRETYAALPPEVFEASHQENPSTKLFGWGKSRSGDRGGSRANAYLEASYNPPWPVTAPRYNSETRRGIVDDLNMSFQDVGLLPAIGEIKHNHNGHNKRKKEQQVVKYVKQPADTAQRDIFEEVPEDSLYMLLPLWPGETDPGSDKKYPYHPSHIPAPQRQYMLVYYKTPPNPVPRDEPSSSKTKAGEKKRSRNSPTSSHESTHERAILLSTFHISARIVSYPDMQGTGVRIPDTGLAVSGPLEDAYDCIPTCQFTGDYVIGVCHSREAGIEFVPEGFDKMGLSRCIPNPRPMDPSEDDDSSSLDTLTVLTPLGRAVMEMAWLGGMALTSFNPNSNS